MPGRAPPSLDSRPRGHYRRHAVPPLLTAPLRVPVECKPAGGGPRWFRTAREISEEGMLLERALPEELATDLRRPLSLLFLLPDDAQPLSLTARAIELPADPARDDDKTTALSLRRGLRFIQPDEETRARIARYVEARLLE